MYKTIEKHFYKKMQESLLNKLLFRRRFIGKRIRLLIGQIINIVAYNFLKLLLGLIFLAAFFVVLFSFILKEENNLTLLGAFISSTTAILISILPKSKRLNGIVTRYEKPKEIPRYGKTLSYQYYVVNVTNPNDFAIPIEKIFLTNGNFVKDYDVVFINSNRKSPRKQIDQEKDMQNYITEMPADICILGPKNTVLVKFATYMDFKFAYIQTTNKKLYKISVNLMNFRSEYDIYRRGVFFNYEDNNAKEYLNLDWIKDND